MLFVKGRIVEQVARTAASAVRVFSLAITAGHRQECLSYPCSHGFRSKTPVGSKSAVFRVIKWRP